MVAAIIVSLLTFGCGNYIEQTKETVQEYFTKFLAMKRQNMRPGTVKVYKWLVNGHIIPQLGQIPLVRLTPHHLVTMYETLRIKKKLSPQTINHVHKVIYDGLATAVRHESLHRNVAALVQPPKASKTKMNVWTDEQLARFLNYVKQYRYYMIILLAAACVEVKLSLYAGRM